MSSLLSIPPPPPPPPNYETRHNTTLGRYEEQGLSSGDNNSRPIRIYLSCVYYIVATLATVGYGDISGDHMEERMLAVAIMLLGTVVFALIISTASMIVQNSSADDAAHGAKIAVVHQFCSSWNISEDLKSHILDFLLLSKDVFVDNTNSSTVLSSLPPDFQCIVTPFLAKDCISRTALFKNCSPEFVSLLLEYLSLETFNASDTIFRAGFTPPLSPRGPPPPPPPRLTAAQAIFRIRFT
jgi:potassium voltage-gated channel Eag-related subfamily H member 1